MDVLELSDVLGSLNDSNELIYIKNESMTKVSSDVYNSEFKEVTFNRYSSSYNSENPLAKKIIMLMTTIPKEAEILIGQYNKNYIVFLKQ